MEAILLIILGMAFGIFATCWGFFALRSGMLVMKQDPEDGTPYLFLEMEKNLNTVLSKKYVLFVIDPEARRPRR